MLNHKVKSFFFHDNVLFTSFPPEKGLCLCFEILLTHIHWFGAHHGGLNWKLTLIWHNMKTCHRGMMSHKKKKKNRIKEADLKAKMETFCLFMNAASDLCQRNFEKFLVAVLWQHRDCTKGIGRQLVGFLSESETRRCIPLSCVSGKHEVRATFWCLCLAQRLKKGGNS